MVKIGIQLFMSARVCVDLNSHLHSTLFTRFLSSLSHPRLCLLSSPCGLVYLRLQLFAIRGRTALGFHLFVPKSSLLYLSILLLSFSVFLTLFPPASTAFLLYHSPCSSRRSLPIWNGSHFLHGTPAFLTLHFLRLSMFTEKPHFEFI